MRDVFERRLEKLRRAFKSEPIDTLMVLPGVNVRYLTGFTGDQSVLLVGKASILVITDGKWTTQLEQECPGLEVHVRPVEQLLFDAVGEVIGRFGTSRLGFEPSKLTMAQHATIVEKARGVDLVGVAGKVEGLRAVKDKGEIEAIRRSIAVAERGFAMLRAGMRSGDSEKDLADALEGYLRRCGAERSAFDPVVAVGVRAALPHAQPTPDSRVGEADFVLVDWGAAVEGYKSDLTRVIVTGKVTPRFEKVYRTVLDAQERGIAALRPGVTAGEVDAAARSAIADAGFGPAFNHGLGHGFGLEIHENPFFRQGNDLPLKAGMVVTVEPGIYLPDWGGVRIEDDVLITPDGAEVLSRVPRSLDAIGWR